MSASPSKTSIRAQIGYFCLILVGACAGGCGAETSSGIHWACEADSCVITGGDVEAASQIALELGNAPGGLYKENWVTLNLVHDAIEADGGKYYGCTIEETMTVQDRVDNALLHEFYHEVLWLMTGDYDATHTEHAKNWQRIEQLKLHL